MSTESILAETCLAENPEVRHTQTSENVKRMDDSASNINFCALLLTFFSLLIIVGTLPISIWFCLKVVKEHERAVIFRLGRLIQSGAIGPGIFFVIPCIDSYTKVDLRIITFNVPPQELLSKDNVTVSVDAVVYYRISNAVTAVCRIAECDKATRLLAATILRSVLGTMDLSDILGAREEINSRLQALLAEATFKWGVQVVRVEMKEVRLPSQLQRAMAAKAEALRESEAKMIAAECEQQVSEALGVAARVISDCPGAIQLRYLQTLNTLSSEKNSTVIFPIPMDLVSNVMRNCSGSNK